MDPMTMMAIANFGMQMMKGSQGGPGGGSGAPAGGAPGGGPGQMQQKQFMPAALPPVNTTDYGSIIKNMLGQNAPQQPGLGQAF